MPFLLEDCSMDNGHQTSKANGSTEKQDQQQEKHEVGYCAICGGFKPLIPLTKQCRKRHGLACYECLRQRFVVQAQATGESCYPLQCFDSKCCTAKCINRTIIRDVQLIKHGLVITPLELKRHYRFSVLAKAPKKANAQTAHCPHCDHPRTFQRGPAAKVFSCQQCSRIFNVEGDSSLASRHMVKDGLVHYTAPHSLGGSTIMDKLTKLRPNEARKLGDCSICFCSMDPDEEEDAGHFGPEGDGSDVSDCVVKLSCGHCFHRGCLEYSLKHYKPVCCVCRKPIQEPRGFCPTGTLSLSLMKGTACPGFTNRDGSPSDTISITYSVPDGTQMDYHPNPGKAFGGDYRVAYLPHNTEGHELLARLVYAWSRGLIFTVGTSLTRNVSNVLVWTSIHHKTSLWGGAHGFPDPGYLYNCHDSLGALYVPDARGCRAAGAGQVINAFLPPPPKSRQQRF